MPPEPHDKSDGDAAYIRDMTDACERIKRFVANNSLAEYQQNDLLRSAVERQIEIIGEAARRVSDEFRRSHPEIPWRPVIAQRHILAHEYGEVEDALIWRVATVHVPALERQLRGLLSPDSH